MSSLSHAASVRGPRALVAGVALMVMAGASTGTAQVAPSQPSFAADSTEAVNAVARFHAALTAGDSTAAIALLSPDVMILEGGVIETLADYRRRHLAADIQASRAATSERTVSLVRVEGSVAWVVSRSTTQRQSGGNTTTSTGAELMVLRRTPDGWRITAIHWSSRSQRSK